MVETKNSYLTRDSCKERDGLFLPKLKRVSLVVHSGCWTLPYLRPHQIHICLRSQQNTLTQKK